MESEILLEKTETEVVTASSFELDDKNEDSVHFIILMNDNYSLGDEKHGYNNKIYGRTILEWVEASCSNNKVTTIVCNESDSIVPLIKDYLNDSKYTIVLYCDTPLIRKATIDTYIADILSRGLNVCKMPRGWIFKTSYLRSVENVYAPQVYSYCEEDFMVVDSLASLEIASNIIKKRILAFHKNSGVKIIEEASTYIDADVEIMAGVTIYPNNHIIGYSVIDMGAIIYPNNVIINSYIGQRAVLKGAYIENAKIKNLAEVAPFTYVIAEKKGE